MAIQRGARVPDVTLRRVGPEGVEEVTTGNWLAGRRVVLFAVPGAFTSTCSDVHLPGFVAQRDAFLAAGIDAVACTAVNDASVLGAWGRSTGALDHLAMLADGNGDLARALGLEVDLSRFGMGVRSKRWAAVIDDGVVTYLGVEDGPEVSVSGAEAVLAALTAARD